MGVIGSVVSAVGAAQQAQAQADQADREAVIEKINARTRSQQGVAESEKIIQEGRSLARRQLALAGAGNIEPRTGSVALLINETEKLTKLDEMSALWNASAEQTNFQNRAKSYEGQAAAYRQAASISFLQGITAIGGALKLNA